MGSVRRWQTRWGDEVCYRDRESPELSRYVGPSELFKGCLTAVGQSGPDSTTLWTQAGVFDHTFIAFQIISTHCPDSFQEFCHVVVIPVWYRGHQSEHRMFTQSSVKHERNWQDTQDQDHGRYSNYTTV